MIKLVATDLDGTFLAPDGTYDQQRLDNLLHKFKERDILFVAASGRSLLTLEKLFAAYRDRIAFIADNGSLVKADGELIFEASISPEQYQDIAALLSASPYMSAYDFLLSGRQGAYLHTKASSTYYSFISQYYDNIQYVSDFAAVSDTILKLTANFSEQTLKQGESWFNERVDYARAVTTGFNSVDIILKNINKQIGLEQLCSKYGIKSSEVLAFGDNLNDFEMLSFAGTAVATGNAQPEIKALADRVIGSCADGAVLAYMERMVT
ncbi:HAD family hydrolase [Streptococcus chenjunshii]|uniref:HAD family hydrolase n=1 Tax=Streptococcus chenjunshii TaxID=2173853 RepID=A0A372KMG3_9STRE|nr:HAD family hydrolase [Streptococcus chenjunshii]AXQ79074.1 HAD family hydrolase [Streptococcus chenjunshii]RFU51270.1 HAD family hydrolase [Streptococcus chenjunshii]RFU53114.1 HAD family hydrolase [Streptococcus chenjunshii]